MTREEAIKILSERYSSALFSERTALETLIPELKESEDEKIRKAILGLTYLDGIEPILIKCSITAQDIRKYLEKQKEQKQSINIDQLKSLMLQYLQEAANEKDDSDIEADTDKWARKILGYDFEQKPIEWSEEDENNTGWLIAFLEGKIVYHSDEFHKSVIKWLRSLRSRKRAKGNY